MSEEVNKKEQKKKLHQLDKEEKKIHNEKKEVKKGHIHEDKSSGGFIKLLFIVALGALGGWGLTKLRTEISLTVGIIAGVIAAIILMMLFGNKKR